MSSVSGVYGSFFTSSNYLKSLSSSESKESIFVIENIKEGKLIIKGYYNDFIDNSFTFVDNSFTFIEFRSLGSYFIDVRNCEPRNYRLGLSNS